MISKISRIYAMNKKTENLIKWENATWQGSRKFQLKKKQQLSYRERFLALEDMAKTSLWLANATNKHKT